LFWLCTFDDCIAGCVCTLADLVDFFLLESLEDSDDLDEPELDDLDEF